MQSLLLAQIQALELSMAPLKQEVTLSYQQQKQTLIMQSYAKYFHTLKQAYIKNPISTLYSKLLHQYSALGSSLWSQVSTIMQYINQDNNKHKHNKYYIISHLHHHSQSPLLALYTKIMGNRVKLVGSKQQINKGWSQCTVKIAQLDKTTAFKHLMTKEGIEVQYFEDRYNSQIQNVDQKQLDSALNIQIIDIFNTHATLFKPHIMKQITQQKNNKIKILHVHPSQAQQVVQFLNFIDKQAQINELSFNLTHPNQSTVTVANKFQEQLLSFLNQQLNHPNKQDVIIFHPTKHSFIKKIKNCLKKSQTDILKHIRLIHDDKQLQKCTLPPPPAFISKKTTLVSTIFQEKQKQKQKDKITQSGIKSQNSSQIVQGSPVKSSVISNSSFISQQKSSQNVYGKSIHSNNNIFIVPNFKTLMEWGYDLSHVFYIFDFRKDQSFYYDYELMTYVQQQIDFVTQKQALLRMSCMGVNKIGKYCYVRQNQAQTNENLRQQFNQFMIDDGKCKDIGIYCLQMIEGGYKQFIKQIQDCKQVKSCVKALTQSKIISKQEVQGSQKYTIAKKQILTYLQKIRDLNPLLCLSILQAKRGDDQQNIPPSKLALLLAIATSVMMTPGNMRYTSNQNNSVINRPSEIWRQSGYLHSSLDAIVRAEIIQHRQSQIGQGRKSKQNTSKRLSKQTSQQFEMFGNLFDIIVADRITFDKMSIQDLLRQQFVDQLIFNQVVDKTQRIAEVLDLEDFIFSSFQNINEVLQDLMEHTNKAIGAYSGSRRVGYFLKGQSQGIFPSKSSLLTVLNERPSFIYVSRVLNSKFIDGTSKLQILMSNNIPEITLIQTIGSLPSRKTKSYGETQIQYHGISSATFKHLWRNNGQEIEHFQEKFGCLVEPNQQVSIISIHCPKQKQKHVKQQFDTVLTKVKQKMGSQTKIAHFLGSTSLLLGSGGKVIQVIKDKYINKCILSNLDLSVQVEDLEDLFQQFFTLKNIQVRKETPSASYKVAYIQFHSQKDFYRFQQYYNDCLYMNRFLKVNAIQSIPTASSLKQQMYLQFTWTAWKSGQQAIVQFQQQQAITKCAQSLKQQKLDGNLINFQLKGNNKIFLKGLNVLTDQINLQKALLNYGKIKSLQILKTICKQNMKSQESFLEQEIRKIFDNPIQIKVKNVEKLKNGLRTCKVIFKDENKLNETITKLNEKTGIMGVGRIHVQSWFIYPIKVPHRYLTLYQQLVNHTLAGIPNNRIKTQNTIYDQQQYIIAKSHLKQQIDVFKQKISLQLQGSVADLTGCEISILLSEVGMQNLVELQEKHNCRLIPDFGKKTLSIIALFDNMKKIKQQIKAKVQDNFFYRIPLNQKSFKHFKQNPENLSKMKTQYHLSGLQLEQVGKNILLEGSANNVQKAFNYLMHIIQSVSKHTQQEMLNTDVCGICCEDPSRPYRLQQCGHKFCLHCLLDNINMALGDMSMFPIKCPQCLVQLAIIDLNELMTTQTWIKLNSMALNQYIGRNSDIVSNCFTAGCKQVNFMIKNYFTCDQCNQSYCMECKLNYHPGLTCLQAKEGGNAAFEKYMKQNGIRKCPNQTCKMPIMRLDGCYRVTCSRCNKSMCFKCEPQKMIAYDHYNDCYKHLTDVHGGYW